MSSDITTGFRLAIARRLVIAAQAQAITVNYGEKFLVVWDETGAARAYSTERDNFHFRVGNVDDAFVKFSLVVTAE